MQFCWLSYSLQVRLLYSLLLGDPWLKCLMRGEENRSCIQYDLMYPSHSGSPFSASGLVCAWKTAFSGKKWKWLVTFQHHFGAQEWNAWSSKGQKDRLRVHSKDWRPWPIQQGVARHRLRGRRVVSSHLNEFCFLLEALTNLLEALHA